MQGYDACDIQSYALHFLKTRCTLREYGIWDEINPFASYTFYDSGVPGYMEQTYMCKNLESEIDAYIASTDYDIFRNKKMQFISPTKPLRKIPTASNISTSMKTNGRFLGRIY